MERERPHAPDLGDLGVVVLGLAVLIREQDTTGGPELRLAKLHQDQVAIRIKPRIDVRKRFFHRGVVVDDGPADP